MFKLDLDQDFEQFVPFEEYSDALQAVSKLNGLINGLPEIDILIETIPLQESWTSCGIENIVTSQDVLFKAMSTGEGSSDVNVREIADYRAALEIARDCDLSVGSIERICSTLKRKDMHVRRSSDERVYLQDRHGNTIRTPPAGDEVPDLLDELLVYVESSKGLPLVKIAVFHALFETIHPFMDGNGRTGRVLIETLLKRFGLLDEPVLFMSGFLITYRRDYYRNLLKVQRDGNWKDWFSFFFKGVKQSSDHVMLKIRLIRESFEKAKVVCNDISRSEELVDLLYSHVYVRVKNLVDSELCSRNTASKYLAILEERGVLRGEQSGKGKIYLNVELSRILSIPFDDGF